MVIPKKQSESGEPPIQEPVSREKISDRPECIGVFVPIKRKSSRKISKNNYRPSDREPFMNEWQRMYFAHKLLLRKLDIIEGSLAVARDRQNYLIAEIDFALQRIENGTYGYCEETGKRISLERLEAYPTARRLSMEAQELLEAALSTKIDAVPQDIEDRLEKANRDNEIRKKRKELRGHNVLFPDFEPTSGWLNDPPDLDTDHVSAIPNIPP